MISLAEEAGTGIPRILEIWRKAGLKLPSVSSDTERYEFELTLQLAHLLSKEDRLWLSRCAKVDPSTGQLQLPGTNHLDPNEQLVLVQARNQGSINNAAVQALTGLHRADISVLLTKLRDRGFLIQESTWRWASYRLADGIKALPAQKPAHKTCPQKPTHIMGKSRQKSQETAALIIEYCKVAKTAREIAERVQKNQKYLVATYLGPLIKEGFLRYTNPSHPNARNQKYIVV